MKNLTLIMAIAVSVSAFAKVGDFNSLIVENSKAQMDLHQNLKQNLDQTKVAAGILQKDSKFIVDHSTSTINVPTAKKFLTFSKEKSYHRPSESQQQKRLAQELSEAE